MVCKLALDGGNGTFTVGAGAVPGGIGLKSGPKDTK